MSDAISRENPGTCSLCDRMCILQEIPSFASCENWRTISSLGRNVQDIGRAVGEAANVLLCSGGECGARELRNLIFSVPARTPVALTDGTLSLSLSLSLSLFLVGIGWRNAYSYTPASTPLRTYTCTISTLT